MAKPKVAIIGGGIFGVATAAHLAENEVDVTVYERLPSLIEGASYNNQNRLHRGFHYPRDDQTAKQCERGFSEFKQKYKDSILGNFQNAYFIASQGSRTTPEEFLSFCDRNELPFTPMDPADFKPTVQQVALGGLTDEVVYDSSLLRKIAESRLGDKGVAVHRNVEIVEITKRNKAFSLTTSLGDRISFDAVVNCSYADINRLSDQLGIRVGVYQYEYTAVAVISLNWKIPTGITILDGEFMTVLPFGRTGDYLLYHVKHAVIDRTDDHFLPTAWRNKSHSPFRKKDRDVWFSRELLPDCSRFVPDLACARLKGHLEGPRVVLSNHEDNDARPSIVEQQVPGYVTVFSGKIDHSAWVPDLVQKELLSSIF